MPNGPYNLYANDLSIMPSFNGQNAAPEVPSSNTLAPTIWYSEPPLLQIRILTAFKHQFDNRTLALLVSCPSLWHKLMTVIVIYILGTQILVKQISKFLILWKRTHQGRQLALARAWEAMHFPDTANAWTDKLVSSWPEGEHFELTTWYSIASPVDYTMLQNVST